MEKTVIIDGRPVKFRATAAVPRLYRIKFRRDIIQDIAALEKVMRKKQATGEDIPPEALEMFENVSFIMARHAAPEEVPDTPEAWLDAFATFSIYQVLPEILELWQLNMEQVRRIVRDEWARMEAERAALPASGWAEEELAAAVARGITDGTRPQSYATRQEVMVVAGRLGRQD